MTLRRPFSIIVATVCLLSVLFTPHDAFGATTISTPSIAQSVQNATTQKVLGSTSPTLAQLGGGDSRFVGPYA